MKNRIRLLLVSTAMLALACFWLAAVRRRCRRCLFPRRLPLAPNARIRRSAGRSARSDDGGRGAGACHGCRDDHPGHHGQARAHRGRNAGPGRGDATADSACRAHVNLDTGRAHGNPNGSEAGAAQPTVKPTSTDSRRDGPPLRLRPPVYPRDPHPPA